MADTLLRLGEDLVVVKTVDRATEPRLHVAAGAWTATNGANLNYAQVKMLHETLGGWLEARRLETPGKTYDHDPRPDDSAAPGDRCRDCGEDITWIGPDLSSTSWMHVDDEENR